MTMPSHVPAGAKYFPITNVEVSWKKYINSGAHKHVLEKLQYGHLCLLCIETTWIFILRKIIKIKFIDKYLIVGLKCNNFFFNQ